MVKINIIVDGGKATASPQLSQCMGPMKINMQEVITKINKKTESFNGIKVPVEIIVNERTKEYEIKVGSPPTSELIKKEMEIEKGSATPDKIKSGNISIEQLIKIAKMKSSGMFVNSLKAAIKTVAGSCNSLGILIEGMTSAEFNVLLEQGAYENEIKEEKTEPDKEKLNKLQIQLKEVQDKLNAILAKKKAAEEEAKKEEPKKEEEEKKEGEEGKEEKKEGEAKEEKPKEEKKKDEKEKKK